ncbi:alanine racemase [Candidatus Saccharibacteria bacterium]|nr:alanine racemase [Candidatus Saccharibacteria bacterium]
MYRHNLKNIVDNLQGNRYETYNIIEISRANLLKNIEIIRKNNPGQIIIPVIKSNAYGHGIDQVAKILDQSDIEFVAVDGYFEAHRLLKKTRLNVLVMGAIKPSNAKLVDTKRCSFVVQDIKGLQAFGSLNKKVKVHIELNTGMNRLGLSEKELDPYLKALQKYPNLEIEGIMSHLADADSADNSFTYMQLENFDSMLKTIIASGQNPKYIHLAQTAGSTKIKHDLVNGIRLGIGLYGINPLENSDPKYRELDQLEPVLSLKSTIIKINELKEGDKVSYNGIFTAKKPMNIGVLPLGYYEGYPRSLSNKGVATYKNEKLPIVGRVCMNHTMLDLDGTNIAIGTEVTLISNNKEAVNSVVNICKNNDIFSYQLVTGLNDNIRRIII